MLAEEDLSDDYIASLLAKDARTSNAKYPTYGLQELLPRRATTNAPKPNTRFLKNIIRETDSHNAALRAKELEEAKARLRKLRDENGTSRSYTDGYGRLTPDDGHGVKRRRLESEDNRDTDRRRDHGKSHSHKETEKDSHRYHRHRSDSYHTDEVEDKRSHHHQRRHHHRRSRRQCSASRAEERRRRLGDLRHPNPRHRSRSRSPSPRGERHSHGRRSTQRKSSLPESQTSGTRDLVKANESEKIASCVETKHGSTNGERYAPSPASDSDPLESIIGPPPLAPVPKVRARGRGTFTSSSAMDSHFSSNYDPTTDVQPDLDEVDDWDMALEALRDRQRWQKQGADRLKSAGFTEEEVQKWEKGGEKREEDVRWKGKGEGREWDRGKVVGKEGVETKPEWGRLKGT